MTNDNKGKNKSGNVPDENKNQATTEIKKEPLSLSDVLNANEYAEAMRRVIEQSLAGVETRLFLRFTEILEVLVQHNGNQQIFTNQINEALAVVSDNQVNAYKLAVANQEEVMKVVNDLAGRTGPVITMPLVGDAPVYVQNPVSEPEQEPHQGAVMSSGNMQAGEQAAG